MAAQRPLYYDSATGSVKQFTSAQLNTLVAYGSKIWRDNIGTSLSNSGSSSIGQLTDYRLIAGTYATNATTYPDAQNAYSIAANTYNIHQVANAATGATDGSTGITNTSRPIFWNPDLKITQVEEARETFIYPLMTQLANSTIDDNTAGVYHISTSNSIAGSTLIATIFSDTRANTGAYSAGAIPNTQDQPTTIANYYLHVRNYGGAAYSGPLPLCVKSDTNDMRTMTFAEWTQYMRDEMRYVNASVTGYRLRYSWASSAPSGGVQRGSSVTDTRLNSQTTLNRFVSADDYRTQDVPGGTATVVGTRNLYVYLT
jgi:hypothetical protein